MKRLNPFSGQNISLFDLTFSTIETTLGVKERISDLYNFGAVTGLTVGESGTYPGEAYVTLGTAYDRNGERVRVPLLEDGLKHGGQALNAVATSYVIVARYAEGNDGTSGLDVDGISNFRHLTDDYNITVLRTGVDSLQDDDIRLSGVETTLVGSSLIIDGNQRDTFSSKINSSIDVNALNLFVPGTFVAGGTASFYGTVTAVSNISTEGDFIATTAGKGLIITNEEGDKTARVTLDADGFLSIAPLNYSL